MKAMVVQSVLVVLMTTGVAGQMPGSGAVADALDGLDPVLLVQGKEVQGKSAISSVYGRFTYLFSTPETKATFERDPARYEIQLGGMCARMGKTTGGNPSDFLVHDGKIYVFGSDECHKRFKASPGKYLPPQPAAMPASKAARDRGHRLLDAAARSVGDVRKLDELTTYVETSAQIQKRPQGEVAIATKTVWRFPELPQEGMSVRQERAMTLMGKTRTSAMVMSPVGAWYVGGPGQVYPVQPAGKASLDRDFARNPVALLKARRSPGLVAAALGPATVEGAQVQPVRIVRGGLDVILNLDAKNRIHSIAFVDRNIEGEYGQYSLLYSDFRDVDGLTLPFGVRALFGGEPDTTLSATINSIAINAPVDPTLFAPQADPGKQ